jgi:hypothetical protein
MKSLSFLILVFLVLGLVFLASQGYLKFPFQAYNPACKVIQPTWAYYECVKSSSPIDQQYSQQSSGRVWSTTGPYEIKCERTDMVSEGYATISTYSGRTATCKIYFVKSQGSSWKFCMPNVGCQDIGYGTLYGKPVPSDGSTIYLAYGESLQFWLTQPLTGVNVVQATISYYQKQLYRSTWTGRKDLIGVGCDMRTLLPASEWNKLPTGATVSLAVGETVNYIDVFIELPTTGNVLSYKGNDVVASPTTGGKYDLYKIVLYQQATPTQSGTYSSQAGYCYYVPGEKVATVDCIPGQQGIGMVCSNDFTWTTLDKGVCIRGGIAYDALCPGQGTYIDKVNNKIVYYKCNVNTGSCDVTSEKSIQCYPGQIPCPAGYVCDVGTYSCVPAPQQLQPCPYEWCPEGMGYIKKDCPAGLQPCPDFTCKQTCAGITPIIPQQPYTGIVGGFNWNMLWAGLAGLLAFLILGGKDIKERNWVGLAIAGIIGVIIGVAVYWILEHLVLIIAGSILGVILGGIILWFLGPAILFVVIMFMMILKTIRGD